ncbi:hypothetical protein GGR56DRAFT_688208 [Xylariaceae sp. FL0804]|nr:hypothetical protein GGR56DRAFT_688208 [Xylariaceae sp. FL0804]
MSVVSHLRSASSWRTPRDSRPPEAPRTGGRSRFSKALPTPPPSALDGRPKTAHEERALPSPPASPFPPRKDSFKKRILRIASSPSLKSRKSTLESPPADDLPPLPPLPPQPAPPPKMDDSPVLPPQMRPTWPTVTVARKPVGDAASSAPRSTDALKREPSISSLLSAYSRTSSDSAQKTSHDSDSIKESEPATPPGREDAKEVPPARTDAFTEFSTNPYAADPSVRWSQVEWTNDSSDEPLPPPLPPKDAGRRTPNKTPPSQQDASQESAVALPPAAPASHDGQEIWRRRASSKSDRSLAVAGLKLAVSHGSTAATTPSSLTSGAGSLPPPALPQSTGGGATTAPLPPKKTDAMAPPPSSKVREAINRAEGRGTPGYTPNSAKRSPPAPGAQGEKSGMTSPPVSGYPRRPSAAGRKSISRRPVGSGRTGSVSKINQAADGQQQMKPTSPNKTSGGGRPGAVPRHNSRSGSVSGFQFPARRGSAVRPSGPGAAAVPEAPKLTLSRVDTLDYSNNNNNNNTNSYNNSKNPHFDRAADLDRSPVSPRAPFPTSKTRTNSTAAAPPHRRPSTATITGPAGAGAGPGDATHWSHSLPLNEAPRDDKDRAPPSAAAAAALARFPRDWASSTAPLSPTPTPASTDPDDDARCWPAAPLGPAHYGCYAGHRRVVPARNHARYHVACQTCGGKGGDDEGSSRRVVCTWCALRVCAPCHEVLVAHGRDLRVAVDAITAKGGSGLKAV